MPDLTPLDDRAIIRPAPPETETASGLLIAKSVAEKPVRGEVLAIGGTINADIEDADREQRLKVGDTVLFSKYAGVEFEHDEEKLLVVRRGDIYARIG